MLKGAQVLVTRPVHQAENLSSLIEEQGGIAVRFPTLAIVPVDDASAIKHTLAQLDSYQWLVFISANAVTMHSNHSDNDKIKKFKSARVAAIGHATAKALVKAGWSVDLTAGSGFDSAALLAMPEWQQITGQRFLIIRGQGGREELATVLQSRGATVDYLAVYKRIVPDSDRSQVQSLLEQDKLDVITITSGEALQNLLVMLEKCFQERLFDIPLVVVSNRIGQIAAETGFKRIAVTHSPSDSAILETVLMCVTGGIA
ncbi:MAG: uroporphyrinogen-III synthase [Methylococcales bacterium]